MAQINDIIILNIRRLLMEQGISQVTLSRDMGIDPTYLSRMLKGSIKITQDMATKVAAAFRVDEIELVRVMQAQKRRKAA